MKKLHFIQEVHMEQQNYMLIGQPLIIERLMVFLPVMEYYSIMKVQEEEIVLFQKITETVAKISKNKNIVLKLGNLNARRDWGYAAEYVEAMWKMLQLKKPYDLVISTGETHSVRDFVNLAFKKIRRQIIWKGEGIEEKGFCAKSNRLLVKIDPYYFRPTEVDLLRGDSSLAKEIIKWEPKVTFKALVDLMMDYEISKL